MTEKDMRYFLGRFKHLKMEAANLLLEAENRPTKLGLKRNSDDVNDGLTEIDFIHEADMKIKRSQMIEHHIQLVENILSSLNDLEYKMVEMKYIKKMKAEAVSYQSNYSIAQTKRIYLNALKKITVSYNKTVGDSKDVKYLLMDDTGVIR